VGKYLTEKDDASIAVSNMIDRLEGKRRFGNPANQEYWKNAALDLEAAALYVRLQAGLVSPPEQHSIVVPDEGNDPRVIECRQLIVVWKEDPRGSILVRGTPEVEELLKKERKCRPLGAMAATTGGISIEED
jgi:hypothetical protein